MHSTYTDLSRRVPIWFALWYVAMLLMIVCSDQEGLLANMLTVGRQDLQERDVLSKLACT